MSKGSSNRSKAARSFQCASRLLKAPARAVRRLSLASAKGGSRSRKPTLRKPASSSARSMSAPPIPHRPPPSSGVSSRNRCHNSESSCHISFANCCCLERAPLCTRLNDGRRAPFGRRGRPRPGVPLPPRGAAPVCRRCPGRVAPASLALRSCLPGPPDRGPVFRRCPVQEVVPRRIGVAVFGVLALSAPESRLALAFSGLECPHAGQNSDEFLAGVSSLAPIALLRISAAGTHSPMSFPWISSGNYLDKWRNGHAGN